MLKLITCMYRWKIYKPPWWYGKFYLYNFISRTCEKLMQICKIQSSKEIENIKLWPLCYICTKSQKIFLIICFTELSLCRDKFELLLARAGWLVTHRCQSVSTPADTVATECDWRDELTRLRVSFNYVYSLKYFFQIHLNSLMF